MCIFDVFVCGLTMWTKMDFQKCNFLEAFKGLNEANLLNIAKMIKYNPNMYDCPFVLTCPTFMTLCTLRLVSDLPKQLKTGPRHSATLKKYLN